VPEVLRVVLATTNRGKLADFRRLFGADTLDLVSTAEVGIALEVEETGVTFAENALLKARAACEASGMPALADDSGLAVCALGGRPGVVSARYAGSHGNDHANNKKVIAELRGIEDRRAAFVCALALVFPDGAEITSQGRCEGRIIDEERGTNGFGYDAIFYRDDLGMTFGEATPEQKNARSHRGGAVRSLVAELRSRGVL
jgi:XTP/dITP diphosphohydrolase